MRYIYIENPGPQSKLVLSEKSGRPDYSDSQILVQVKAIALNMADLMQRQGFYPPPPGETEIPGLELSGEVVAVGNKVDQFKPGDSVYGLVPGGSYAEFCPVEASLAHIVPASWNFIQAAALPEALMTVYSTLYDLGSLKAGQTLLIHGAGSGISSLAIQMAKHTQANIITTVGESSKIEKAKALGASQVINYNTDNFAEIIGNNNVDLILDYIGGDYFEKHLNLLKTTGTLLQIACLKGANVNCNLPMLMQKRLNIKGFILRSQSVAEKSRLWELAHKHWYDLLSQERIKPIIDSHFTFDEMEQAHQHFQEGKHFGKIVVQLG